MMQQFNIDKIVICDIPDKKSEKCAVFASTPLLGTTAAKLLKYKLQSSGCEIPVEDEGDDAEKTVLRISPIVSEPEQLVDIVCRVFRGCDTEIECKGRRIALITVPNSGDGVAFESIRVPIITERGELRDFISRERKRVLNSLFDAGVEIPCYDGVEIAPEVKVEEGAVILSGTKLSGNTVIAKNAVIGPNSMIADSSIGQNTIIEQSKVTSSVIERDVKIGPFTQVRPNCVIKSGTKIGDFVEVKNSNLGNDVHISHLTYVGDSDVGCRVNFGCGTVTSNYDGLHKYRTTIGDDVFLGCNTNLIAPVKVGNGAYTAAGSTITKDVPDGSLAVARARQTVIDGWAAKRKK